MAAITEFFRAYRQAAAIMHFCALGYSRSDGQTSDEWIDVEKLTWDPDFYNYVRDAFAPVGLMLDVWEDEFPAGKKQEFPVIIFNDLEKEWKGEVQFRLTRSGETILEKKVPAKIAGNGTSRIVFTATVPEMAADYQAEAILLITPTGPVKSLRDFSVLTPQQREARRNLAQGRPVKASTVLVKDNTSSRAEFSVDGDRSTAWKSDKGNPQWLAVDLGENQTISRIELSWDWGVSSKLFLIQVSADGEIWDTVKSVNEEILRTETIRFTSAQTRWIRLFFTGKDKGDSYSLYEIAVYH
jgi:hypothetical protein